MKITVAHSPDSDDAFMFYGLASGAVGAGDIEVAQVLADIETLNRAAFEGHPEIYQPRYGGYDPVGIARGVALAGSPLVWSIVGDRLYLFYSEAARATFIADPQAAIAAADGRWQGVRQQHGPRQQSARER